MEKVYIVTAGSYSDYHIEAVYTNKERADEHVKRGGEEYDVEDFEVNKPIPPACLQIEMSKEGEVRRIFRVISDFPGFNFYSGQGTLFWTVKTDNEERAIKVVNEKRAQILALGIWDDRERMRQWNK